MRPAAAVAVAQEGPMGTIRRVGVVGAGVMGSGIAAHAANAGLQVVLLDIVPPNLGDDEKDDRKARNRFAQGGLTKAIKAKPAAFFHASHASLITVGNTEDDLDELATCDLVIEAIIERLEPKQTLFTKLEKIVARARHRRVQHQRPAHRRNDGRTLGGLPQALPGDALLQPRAFT